jgi:ParB family chromosome partitioning protein
MNKVQEKQRKVLGRGLSALLPPGKTHASGPPPEAAPTPSGPTIAQLRLDQIDPNPLQPRTVFDHNRISELAASIQSNGIIQPLIVRRKGDRYELVAGERRLRASKVANLETVPAIIQDYADDRILEVAIVENLQREDLNPIETAQALDRLGRDLHLTHEEIGQRTGKDRSTVANLLRLLKLPDPVQLLLAEHRLQVGHARALLGLPTPERQIELAERAAAQGYSVRQVERFVQEATREREEPQPGQPEKPQDPNVAAAIRDLESALGTRVRIVERTDQRGKIEIEYYSQDDLNRIYEIITGAVQPTK